MSIDDEREATARAWKLAKEQRELEMETEQARRRMLAAGFPERALKVAREREPQLITPALRATRLWAEGPGSGNHPKRNILLLIGNPGCGKTTAAVWWALHMRLGRAAFIRAAEYAALPENRRAAIRDVPALVFDDLGTEKDRRSVAAEHALLIDVFYADQKPLVITTMLSLEELAERFRVRVGNNASGYVIGRLRESGCIRGVPGTDLRANGEED